MKLLNCLVCHDIVKIDAEWAHCKCEKSCARYAPDNRHAEIFGPSRIMGIDNRDYATTIKDPYYRACWFIIREPNERVFRHNERPNTDEESNSKCDESVIPNRVWVGQLDERATENDLHKVFSKVGDITKIDIVVNRDGTSRGYAFITYNTDEEAQNAIRTLGGQSVNGKEIVVKEVRMKQKDNNRPFYGHANRYQPQNDGGPNVQYRPKRSNFRTPGYAHDPFNPFNDR